MSSWVDLKEKQARRVGKVSAPASCVAFFIFRATTRKRQRETQSAGTTRGRAPLVKLQVFGLDFAPAPRPSWQLKWRDCKRLGRPLSCAMPAEGRARGRPARPHYLVSLKLESGVPICLCVQYSSELPVHRGALRARSPARSLARFAWPSL